MLNIFQIYYDDAQRGSIMFQPYKNEGLTPFFENEVFRKLHEEDRLCKGDLCGVLSWRFKNKGRINSLVTEEGLEAYAKEGVKVLSFFPEFERKATKHNPFTSGDGWHRGTTPGFTEILDTCLKRIGHEVNLRGFTRVGGVVYSNYFLCSPDIMREFLEEWLIPGMELMEKDEEVKKMVWQDARYYRKSDPKIRDRLRKYLGVSYYPLHAFILERFFPAFLQKNSHIGISHYKNR